MNVDEVKDIIKFSIKAYLVYKVVNYIIEDTFSNKNDRQNSQK